MAKVDKYFLGYSSDKFNYLDKKTNVNVNIGYMLNRSNAMFRYDNLPDTIPSKELEIMLQTQGYAIFLQVDNDYYVVYGGLGGETDVYNRPTKATISIPYLDYNATLDIGTDCVVIYNDTTGLGLLPLYAKYSTLLNENMISMLIATVNKRIHSYVSANDDNTVLSAEMYLKKVFDGEIGIIAESKLFDSLHINSVSGRELSLKDLIEYEQYIKASLYNEIGLSANYNMKKERLTREEFTTNSDSLYPLTDDMLNSRRKALEEINSLYELDIMVDFNSSWKDREYRTDIEPLEQDKDDTGVSTISTEDTADEPTEDTTDEPTEDTTDEPTEDTTDEPTEDTTDEPTEDTTDEPTEDTTDEPTEDTTDEPDKDDEDKED